MVFGGAAHRKVGASDSATQDGVRWRETEGDSNVVMRAAFVVLVVAYSASGCAWRTATAEHYFGPVLFRYSPPEGDAPATNQVVAVGALGEAGRQWGMSLGVVERITVSPAYMRGTEREEAQQRPQWSMLLGGLVSPAPRRWTFSPVYLRVDEIGVPALVVRRLYGAQIVAGPEVRAASLGVVSLARVDVPDDAIALIDYDSRVPMAARFRVWRVGPDHELPPLHVLQEITP